MAASPPPSIAPTFLQRLGKLAEHLAAPGAAPPSAEDLAACLAAEGVALRPGDILGALTGDAGIPGTQVGKIAIFDFQAFVAVERGVAKQALQRLNSGKIKGRSLKVRII